MLTLSTTFSAFGEAARAGAMGAQESWGTFANAELSDNARATYSNNQLIPMGNGYTHYLTATTLVAKVPAGSIINAVRIYREANGTEFWRDSAAYLMVGGVIDTSENKADATPLTGLDTIATYQSWARALTAAEINGVFGIAYSAEVTGGDAETQGQPGVDQLRVEVDYTPVARRKGGPFLLLRRRA